MRRAVLALLLGVAACAGGPEATGCDREALAHRLADAHSRVRRQAARTLGRCGLPGSTETLAALAADPAERWWVREEAIHALAGRPDSLSSLARLATTPGLELELRLALAGALQRYPGAAEACAALEHLAGLGDTLLTARSEQARRHACRPDCGEDRAC